MVNAKVVAGQSYILIDQLSLLDNDTRNRIEAAVWIAKAQVDNFNIIKLHPSPETISLLYYPDFFEVAFPSLSHYWTVDLTSETCRYRTYESSLNPPILHRKELLLPKEHAMQPVYQALTESAEQIGLFDDPNRIGFKQAWEALINQRGYKVAGHELVPIGNEESIDAGDDCWSFEGIARHRTALARSNFSAPLQTLARFGLLDGSRTVFDYGCGRGDDVRGLLENNIQAAGWDPYYAAEGERRPANLVNLGFVINVIEDLDERVEALRAAYELAEELLVISAMLANQENVKGTPYGDGVLTTRNTFQKYYTQGELKQFISDVLQEEPIPIGPGIFYVFKDKYAEQRFLYGRFEGRRNVLRLARLSRPMKQTRTNKANEKYEAYRELLEHLWETCLLLGRDPDRSEINNLVDILSAFGSLPAAIRFLKSRKDNAELILEAARESRVADLNVYFAQLQFEKRKPYQHMELRLQRDIKVFYGNYNNAVAAGRQLLFALGDINAINQACRESASHGIGWFEDSESLQVHASLVAQLHPILRVYVNCSAVLYGDVGDADLIKIHIRSGKLTLMKFDDFIGSALPRMTQRIKLNLRRQDFEVFDYGEIYTPPYLYRKSRFINEEFPNYAEQITFEEKLDALGLFDFSGYGPQPNEFEANLAAHRYQVEGLALIRSCKSPDIDGHCGKYFRYRDLIACGETQTSTGLANLPRESDSYTALFELATKLLDPIIDYFGMINLTYGFCSVELGKHIKRRTAPKLDQHAAHERNRVGKPVCDRLGAAVDFLVEDEDMIEVAKWIGDNLPFDRMYVYGPSRPIHLSYGPQLMQQVTFMLPTSTSARMPKVIPLSKLAQAIWPRTS